MEATLSSKNQVTIPKEVRQYLNLQAGDGFKFFFQPDGRVVILPKLPAATLKGTLPRRKKAVPVEEMNAAIAAGATRRARR